MTIFIDCFKIFFKGNYLWDSSLQVIGRLQVFFFFFLPFSFYRVVNQFFSLFSGIRGVCVLNFLRNSDEECPLIRFTNCQDSSLHQFSLNCSFLMLIIPPNSTDLQLSQITKYKCSIICMRKENRIVDYLFLSAPRHQVS